jgi:hypothetical protein
VYSTVLQRKVQYITEVQYVLGSNKCSVHDTCRLYNHQIPFEIGLIHEGLNSFSKFVERFFRNAFYIFPGLEITTGKQIDKIGNLSPLEDMCK